MKIIIGTTIVPHIFGGGTQIIDWLEIKLKEYGHQVDVAKIPCHTDHRAFMQQMLSMRLYHLEDYCERLVCVRMPAHMLKHDDKYLWFIHHYRQVYDLWHLKKYSVPHDAEGKAVREFVMRADNMAFAEAKKIYTNSQVVSRRLMDFNGVASTPVYPPLLESDDFYCEGYGDYIYYPCRISEHKRQDLAIKAMKYTKSGVKLLVTGIIESPLFKDKIEKLIKQEDLQQKVAVRDEWIEEEEKRKLLAECLAVAYIPLDEDSYGYPSLEAHHSGKAVVSCTDSGGTDELIVDGQNGYLVESDPKELAKAFDKLYEDKKMAERMGNAGRQRILDLGITWDNVIGRFTS